MPSPVQTADDLLQFREPGKAAELVRGVLMVREPPATSHGGRAARLARRIGTYVEDHGLGEVFAQDTGFRIQRDPDTVRAPDVAFVARERLPLIPEQGYADLAPDLVVEILSPGDRAGEVLDKVGQWLTAGARLVWVLDPARAAGRVYRADGSVAFLTPGDDLAGENILPGFRCPVREVL